MLCNKLSVQCSVQSINHASADAPYRLVSV